MFRLVRQVAAPWPKFTAYHCLVNEACLVYTLCFYFIIPYDLVRCRSYDTI